MTYAIIRKGTFGECGKTKLYYTCAGLGISLLSQEYFHIFGAASIIWATVEYLLVLTRIRVIESLKIGNHRLGRASSAILRGGQEGGFVTIFSLSVGDFLHQSSIEYWVISILSMFLFFVNTHSFLLYLIKNESFSLYRKSSQRKIFSSRCVGAVSVVSSINLYYLTYCNEIEFYRIMRFMTIMFCMSTFWTLDQICRGVRGSVYLVDYRLKNHNLKNAICKRNVLNCDMCYYYCSNTFIENFLIFSYDVVFEICSAYLIFYILVKTCGNY